MPVASSVTIRRSSPRYVAWLHVFGDEHKTAAGITVPVTSPVPVLGTAPGVTNKEFYRLDVPQLTEAQRDRLLGYLARTFSISRDEAAELLNDPRHGLPILADEHVIAPAMDLRHFV